MLEMNPKSYYICNEQHSIFIAIWQNTVFKFGNVAIMLPEIYSKKSLYVYLRGKILSLMTIRISLNLGNNVEVLMSGNVRCYNIVVEAMKAFPVHEKIQEVSCCLLHRLTLGEL